MFLAEFLQTKTTAPGGDVVHAMMLRLMRCTTSHARFVEEGWAERQRGGLWRVMVHTRAARIDGYFAPELSFPPCCLLRIVAPAAMATATSKTRKTGTKRSKGNKNGERPAGCTSSIHKSAPSVEDSSSHTSSCRFDRLLTSSTNPSSRAVLWADDHQQASGTTHPLLSFEEADAGDQSQPFKIQDTVPTKAGVPSPFESSTYCPA